MKKITFTGKQQLNRENQQNPFSGFTRKLTVHNKWQKIVITECYNDFCDGGYLEIDSFTKSSITYKVKFMYKINMNSFSTIFFDNIRAGRPEWVSDEDLQ